MYPPGLQGFNIDSRHRFRSTVHRMKLLTASLLLSWVSLLAAPLGFSEEEKEKPRFVFTGTGSFYDPGDYFTNKVSVYEDRVVAEFKGYDIHPWAFFGTKPEERGDALMEKTVVWKDPKVVANFLTLAKHVDLLEARPEAIGQGLSISMDFRDDAAGKLETMFYFAVDSDHVFPNANQSLWIASRVIGGDDPAPFLKKLDHLSTSLKKFDSRTSDLDSLLGTVIDKPSAKSLDGKKLRELLD